MDMYKKKGWQSLLKPTSLDRVVVLREFLLILFLLLLLVLADILCYQQGLSVDLNVQGREATLHVGSQILPLGRIGKPILLQFSPYDPVMHEYQIDGTDSTNNFTLDPAYLQHISSSPYYHFQSWMRNLDGTSRWSDLRVYTNDRLLISDDWPANGATVPLPASLSSSLHLHLLLRRPETPTTLNLTTDDDKAIQIMLDRNNRKIEITEEGNSEPIANAFFPIDILPFAAMLLDTLIRITICAVLLLLIVQLCETTFVLISGVWSRRAQQSHGSAVHNNLQKLPPGNEHVSIGRTKRMLIVGFWHKLTRSLHPIALVVLVGSLCFVAWIAYVQYQGEPHIYDASAYLFAAKMYALGHFSVPLPPAAEHFPGPFMLQFAGRWFGQYAPGTALTLVPGIWLGVPWLVEPVLGTFALLGIGLIAARLYDRRVATLSVILGGLSPFYSYLAASYLSHAIALFYLVWGLWALLRFVQGEARWNLPLATLFFGMAGLTRDQVAVLFGSIIVLGILALTWQQIRMKWRQWVVPGLLSLAILLGFVAFTLGFNMLLTHNPWISPRLLFFAGDHWGFGDGVGFYGRHTLAAGLVNLDEQLTILLIDLYGWPFYFTLAFLAIPFLTRKVVRADVILLIWIFILVGAYAGYFYHGIYLGPRYLFETLPFLLMLTARGILVLATTGSDIARTVRGYFHESKPGSPVRAKMSLSTMLLVALLLCCNLLYFLPRQIELHENYSGLPNGYHIDLAAVYHPHLHNALVISDNQSIYQFVLFPLNDPLLRNDVIYAWANTSEDYAELRAAFPHRQLFYLSIAPGGSVQYMPVANSF